MEKKTKQITDNELIEVIKDRLKKDPLHYIDLLKDIIDSVKIKALDPQQLIEQMKFSPGIDILFYPCARKCLIKQKNLYFRSNDLKAKEYLQQIGEALIAKGQGRPKSISMADSESVIYDYHLLNTHCKKIFKSSRQSTDNRRLLIKEYFPDIAVEILKDESNYHSAVTLRNVILRMKYKCTSRAIAECIRAYNRERKKLKKEFPEVFSSDGIPFRFPEKDRFETTRKLDPQIAQLLAAEGEDFEQKWKDFSEE